MQFAARLASVLFALLVFLLVFEMVRRRRLRERYALLWLAASLALIVLAIWTQLLTAIAHLVGIKTPSNAFFVIAFGFMLLLLLHLSALVSRFADETHVLAQRLALLEQRQHAHEQAGADRTAAGADRTAADAAEVPWEMPQPPEPPVRTAGPLH
jgi:hypothetical protein